MLWVPPTAPEPAIERTRSDAERRDRTTTAVLTETAQNGTSGCSRIANALHVGRHEARRDPFGDTIPTEATQVE